tara:strand:- start:5358 stop:6221 length:864 start_codon:yes stop_codon:yes gene_type:complete
MDYPFYVNDFDRVKNHKETFPTVGEIFKYPQSFWYGEKNGKGGCPEHLTKSLNRLLHRADPQWPVLVCYNLPERDMGHFSKGGASSKDNYLEFVKTMANCIGDRELILILEPDAIPHSTLISRNGRNKRLALLQSAVDLITSNCKARLYIDVGHSNWLSPEETAQLFSRVANNKTAGFSVNVSNYRTTKESMDWAKRVCEHLDDSYSFVIDTSRNGNGPYGNDWCNPPDRALGIPPTCDTADEKCDAFLWIKIPGESDGKCNGGPRAGRFWPEYAEELVKNTNYTRI